MTSSDELDELAVENFRTYLRFATVHPKPDYTDAVKWLRSEGEKIGLECFVTEIIPENPILVMRWQGSDPSLRSIMLNSHMDVVPVEREKWTYDPFAAEMTPDGNIYGRGAQDMKCVGIQQLESIRRLKLEGFVPRRTIYITFVPDEELGGACGMQPFVNGVQPTNAEAANEIRFADMNVGLCLDEGIASPHENEFFAFYEERSPWWVSFVIPGQAGHGSKFIENTAVEKLYRLMGKLLAFRESEMAKFKAMPNEISALGSVVTTNINVIRGGVQTNVVPAEIEVEVDFRLPPTLDFAEFDRQLHTWAAECGDGIQIKHLRPEMDVRNGGRTCVDPSNQDPHWLALKSAIKNTVGDVNLRVALYPAGTDSKHVRRYHRMFGGQPIMAIGFSPIRGLPSTLHEHNEFLTRESLLEGLCVYTEWLRRLSLIVPESDASR